MRKTLDDWMHEYHNLDEYQSMFYLMSLTMKYIHSHNYQITNFNPNKIVFETSDDVTSHPETYVIYQNIESFGDDPVKDMHNNMYNLAFLQVGIYSSTLPYLKPDFLKENFNQFKPFLPEDDIIYYQRVLVNNNYFYYNDYRDQKNQQQIDALTKQTNSGSGDRSKTSQLTKATAAGKLYNFDDKDNNPMAAFVSRFLLPFLVISLSLLIPIAAFIFGQFS